MREERSAYRVSRKAEGKRALGILRGRLESNSKIDLKGCGRYPVNTVMNLGDPVLGIC